MLTFIATIFKYPAILPLMERSLPWGALADLAGTAFRRSGGPHKSQSTKEAAFFGSNLILPEDWSLRSMEWTNRHLYERGFWSRAHKGPLGALVHGKMDVIIPSNNHVADVCGRRRCGTVGSHLGWPWQRRRCLGKSRWFQRNCQGQSRRRRYGS